MSLPIKICWLAIQFARLSGFSPIVTTASPHNTVLVKSIGATHVIDRNADILVEAAKIFATAPKPNVVYDAISGPTQEVGWSILAPGGTMVLVHPVRPGINSGEDGKTAFMVWGGVDRYPEFGRSMFGSMTELLQSGDFRVSCVSLN